MTQEGGTGGRTLGLLCGRDSEKCKYFWSHLVGSNRCSCSHKTLVVTIEGKKSSGSKVLHYDIVIDTFRIYITLDSFP